MGVCGGEAELLETLEEMRNDPEYEECVEPGMGCTGSFRSNDGTHNRNGASAQIKTLASEIASISSMENVNIASSLSSATDNIIEDLDV